MAERSLGSVRQLRQSALALVVIADLVAQQPKSTQQPRFEVVSIRAVPRDAPPVERSQTATSILPGGQYVDSRIPLAWMIAFAYDVKNPSHQLVGLPNWTKNQQFAVAAKPGEDFPVLSPQENREQVRLMVRAMLEDRFGLQIHTETREERVYSLRVSKGGIKSSLKKVDPPVPPAKEGFVNAAMGNSSGRIIGNKSTMAGFATMLAIFLKQPVLNETGLSDYYDFDVAWTAPENPNVESSSGFGTDGISLLFSTLQDNFGLTITAAKGPVQYWVVDQVQPPTEN